jgi:hypothetical protein
MDGYANVSVPVAAAKPAPVVQLHPGNMNEIAKQSTQTSHFTVSTVLLIVVVAMIGIMFLMNAWYYWFSHSSITTRISALHDTVNDHASTPPSIPPGTFYTETAVPTLLGSMPIFVTPSAGNTAVASPGSNTRAGAVTVSVPGTIAAGGTIASVGYQQPYGTSVTPAVVLTNKSVAGAVTVQLTPQLGVTGATYGGFTVINAGSSAIVGPGDIGFYYQTYGVGPA